MLEPDDFIQPKRDVVIPSPIQYLGINDFTPTMKSNCISSCYIAQDDSYMKSTTFNDFYNRYTSYSA